MGVAAAVVIAAGVSLVLDWRSSRQEIADLRDRLTELAPSVRQARELTDRASFARGWYDRRPAFLDCLREVTLAFPQEGKVWATNVTVREDMRVVLSGKSEGTRAVLDLLDSLKSSPRLVEVKQLYIRRAGTNTQEVSFAISLRFAGAK
jgi:hypothetical protein